MATKTAAARESAISTQAQHTPGPWRAAIGDDWSPRETESNQEIACIPHQAFDAIDILGPLRVEHPEPHRCSWEEFQANANLIAAAPDLLAALKAVTAVIAGDATTKFDLIFALEKARAAITKATGVASTVPA